MRRFIVIFAVLIAILPALAQDKADAEQEKSALLAYVEEQLSTPNRIIRFWDIEGVLSSDAKIGRISIADRDGVWLEINDAEIVWTRTALLTGRLVVDKLAAKSIEVSRRPLSEEGAAPSPEASSFSVPELPVSVDLDELTVEKMTFGEGVFGLASELALKGNLAIDTGKLDTGLEISRLDGPGGQLDLQASFSGEPDTLDVDLSLFEPEDGVVANLLNLHGKPAVSLGLKGSGPTSDLKMALTIDADEKRVLTGQARFSGSGQDQRFDIGLAGPLGELVRPDLRDLFGNRSELTVTGKAREGGGLDVERFALNSGALELAGSLQTANDGFPLEIAVEGGIQSKTGSAVVLPLPGGNTKVGKADIDFRFGGKGVTTWSGKFLASDFATGNVTAREFVLDLGGAALGLETPAAREVTFVVDGKARGLGSPDAAIADAIGSDAGIEVSGVWKAAQPLMIDKAVLETNAVAASFAGQLADLGLDGKFDLRVADATVLSAVMDRSLAGSAQLTADGRVTPATGAFDLALDGTLTDLAVDSQIDGLLTGVTRITGRAARDESGIRTQNLAVTNAQFSVRASGLFGSETADFEFGAAVVDLANLTDRVSGPIDISGAADGKNGIIDIKLEATMASGRLMGRTLSDMSLRFDGRQKNSQLGGDLQGSAFLAGERVLLKTAVGIDGEDRRLNGLEFTAGATRLTGSLAQLADGMFAGDLALKSNDVSTAAALFLTKASGKADIALSLAAEGERQGARLAGTISSIALENIAVGSGEIGIDFTDVFGVPGADGSVQLGDVVAAGMDIKTLDATASKKGEETTFNSGARFTNGATLSVAGSVSPQGDGYRLTMADMELAKGKPVARLAGPAIVTILSTGAIVDGAKFDVGGGSIVATGKALEQLDVSVDVNRVSLDVANAVRPDLALSGTVSGRAHVGGSRAKPEISFDVDGERMSAAVLKDAGLSALKVSAKGRTNGEQLSIDSKLSSSNGIAATAKGTIPLTDGVLAVDVALQSFPLAIVDRMVGRQGLGGKLSGEAKIGGVLDRPTAKFALRGSGIRADALAQAGIAALELGANGSFAGEVITLSSFNAAGLSGLAISGSGRVPLAGSGLNLMIDGVAPLSLANRQLASRGAQAAGTAKFDIRLTGTIRAPVIAGRVSTAGASYADPLANIALRDINAVADLSDRRVVIRQGSARIAAGGSVSVAGSVSLDSQAGYPADLTIGLNNARYADGSLMVATISGNLGVTGALLYDPLIAGSLTVNRAELTIPETIAGGADGIDVKHINPPKKVARTLEFARADDGTPVPSGRPSVARLNILVGAPNKIFVRGRGLDSELGGSVRLTGPITNIQPVGGFQLIRGRLSILGKRIVFDSGKVTLVGDLDPFVNFVAKSEADGATVIITVTGRASDPSIVFSSEPELPQDEVLSRLIFGRSITELSALQVAKLAASAAQLAGGSNSSLLDSFRQSTGLDELDVVTDSGGNAAVRAGRYLNDNVYLGVEAGAAGSTKGTINIDITDSLKATGSTGSDGNSSIGIFFEKDY